MSYHSSIPTPISGAGSPSSPGSNPELQTVKHEPGADHGSPHSASRADWQYGNPVAAYHSNPHSPGDMGRPPYAMYDGGMDPSDDSDIQRHDPYWTPPNMTAETLPYPMEMDPSAIHSVHSLHHHQSQLHQQPHEAYEQRNYHASGVPAAEMRGLAQPYPPFHQPQPTFMHTEHSMNRRESSKAVGGRSQQRTPRRPSAVRRVRNKRATPRPRAGSDDRPERYPYNPEERLILDDSIKEQDKFLYNLRCENGARNGDDMWDVIVNQYAARYSYKAKATLQMQLNRAVSKHQVWPEAEVSLRTVETANTFSCAGAFRFSADSKIAGPSG